ncbi:MAG: hypothetical protein CMO07_16975 [Thalassospira sp.]|uniref:Uncharacterized protein n=1 Tax=Thalassospira tepidiphila MCCC 1A03514 TaxID=1177930 RepID=A0A853L5B0_9PROT|nr:hypothetical protein [Thalassospira sp.]OAZ11921.1 hypothetical protein TH4_02250 [Thalassospira tepidiphila MCCC 1A03514]|tara:strand:- start:814 stop:2316 length:1503 start_codon:yes stop_codon:yes gene_type:complete
MHAKVLPNPSHEEVNSRFIRLDNNPVILETSFRGWWAWPIVKERLWLYCLNNSVAIEGGSRIAFSEVVLRISSGLWQVVANLSYPSHKSGAVFYEARPVLLPSGQKLHPHLGNLERIERNRSWIHYRFPWGRAGKRFPFPGEIEDYGISSVVAVFASVLRKREKEQKIAKLLSDELLKEFPHLDVNEVFNLISDQLARFCCRFLFTRCLLARSRVSKVIVLDADGKVPELAAAKSLGIHVTEIQHGMFSTREPDYSWSKRHRYVPFMRAIPDSQVVFGEVWARQLRQAGYWSPENILVARNPLIEEYRQLWSQQRKLEKPGGPRPLKLLFPTQGYVRRDAISFWTNVLEGMTSAQSNLFHLSIKIHPLERQSAREYRKLAKKYPSTVSVVPDDVEAFDAIIASDVVVGYTSLMMVEAIGIGLSVIGLQERNSGMGIDETFRMPELAEFVVPCFDKSEFFQIVGKFNKELNSDVSDVSNSYLTAKVGIYSVDAPSVEDLVL